MVGKWNYLIILKPTREAMLTEGPTDLEIEVVSQHFTYYKNLVNQGKALLVGRTQENTAETMGLAVVHAPNDTDAWLLANQDPAVSGGVMTAQVRPYAVALLGTENE